jgi:hypothetical protein
MKQMTISVTMCLSISLVVLTQYKFKIITS